MKNLIITINCFLCLSIYTYSQNFFPVSVGNEYQVRNHWHSWGPGGYNNYGTYFNVTTAVKDTLINGELFYLLQNDGNTNPFDSDFLFRYDSLEQKLYIKISGNDSVRLAADFNTAADSHYTSYITGSPREFISSGLSYEEILGDSLWVYKMENPLNDVYTHTFYFADQIGIYYYKYLESNPPFTGYTSEYNVISAILDSSFVNQLVLKIDSLYPVIDRPIDTFPFLLNIPFHCSYSELIENFILIIEIERDSSIIFNQNYNIPYSNPHFQLNPTNLEVGDIIKLKATLTDTSIYQNIDMYPDSGWISFRVLGPVSVHHIKEISYKYELEQNFPNPFNPVSIIKYEIPERTHISLKVYGILGNEIATLVDEIEPAGNYEIKFDGHNLSSGVYIYQLRTESFVQTKKMVLTK